MKRYFLVFAVLVLVAALCGGCAGDRYGYHDQYGRAVATNATIGGSLGAVMGAGIGAVFGGGRGAGQGAAIGAASGALLGASATPYPPYLRSYPDGGYYRSYSPPTPQERIEEARRQGFARGREEAIRREERDAYRQGYYSGSGTTP